MRRAQADSPARYPRRGRGRVHGGPDRDPVGAAGACRGNPGQPASAPGKRAGRFRFYRVQKEAASIGAQAHGRGGKSMKKKATGNRRQAIVERHQAVGNRQQLSVKRRWAASVRLLTFCFAILVVVTSLALGVSRVAAAELPTVEVGLPQDGLFGLGGQYILDKGLDRKNEN